MLSFVRNFFVPQFDLIDTKTSDFEIENSVIRYDFSTDEESSVHFESPESVRMNMSLSPAPISEAENYFLEVLRNERL